MFDAVRGYMCSQGITRRDDQGEFSEIIKDFRF